LRITRLTLIKTRKASLNSASEAFIELSPWWWEDLALLWVLNMSDGSHAILDIAERAGIPFTAVRKAADLLVESDLLKQLPEETL
jgi:hypothetical protein